MPLLGKIVFSLVVLAVAIAACSFLELFGQASNPYLTLFLGTFSVVSFWIFPEVKNKKS